MKRLFSEPKLAVVWTILRIWLGAQWIEAALSKIGNPVWTGDKAGVAISGFLGNAVKLASGEHPAVQGWYAAFIQNFALPNAKLFSYIIPFGELAVGLGLVLGCLTTLALLGGALMNLNFMLAGTTSTNPILYTAAILLLAAGINSYRIGLDYFIFKKHFRQGKNPTWEGKGSTARVA
ncbi:DoxX family membrane protein [Zhaonella formicivorans]|jgi:thiosulfate dehydrogenase [quinone] large subunit|uniref:DoxX family membrane protein n=1 Tax=Zhaonella formicivorans TaxID=2528593 RepID=UPI0010DC1E2C|nr:DoxX family membrane protein [Zhaonella formicivorans]